MTGYRNTKIDKNKTHFWVFLQTITSWRLCVVALFRGLEKEEAEEKLEKDEEEIGYRGVPKGAISFPSLSLLP